MACPMDTAQAWEAVGHLCTLAVRSRYSLLMIVVPGVLAAHAAAGRVPGTLYSLLLLRAFRSGEESTRRFATDLFTVSVVSFGVAALGGVGVSLVAEHGDERFARVAATVPAEGPPADGGGAASPRGFVAWSPCFLAFCLAAGLAFPAACVLVGVRENSLCPSNPRDAVLVVRCIAGGLVVVVIVATLAGAARASLIGTDDWILPVRPPRIADLGGAGRWLLRGAGGVVAFLGFKEGYVVDRDGAKSLLPGQFDLVIAALLAGGAYLACLVRSLRDGRPVIKWCTAAYVLVAVGLVGLVAGGLAFWLDRGGISPIAIFLLYVFGVYSAFGTDHYFRLTSARPSAGEPAAARPPPSLEEAFRRRAERIAPDPDGKRTLFAVAAAGGGIQATAWTARVLTGLVEEVPGFGERLCVLSGVSGGAVGAAYFLSGHYLAPAGQLPEIQLRAYKSLLEPVAWGVAFADLVRALTGVFPRNSLVDRGWALERAIEERLHFDEDRSAPRPETLGDLRALVGSGAIPVPLFNSTCVETGQRVVLSPIRFHDAPRPVDPFRALLLPEDFSRDGFDADPTIATAVRLSATFSYASPIARPTTEDERLWRSLDHGADPRRRALLGYSLCDGGYSDNSGVVAALDACRGMLAGHAAGRDWRVVVIRIEPFPEDPAEGPGGREGFWRMLFGPAVGLLSARVASQEEAAERAIREFRHEMAASGVEVRSTTLRFETAGDRPPLSWALSPRQQRSIEESWRALVSRRGHGDRDPLGFHGSRPV